jgi:hypothetical protein
MRASWTWENTWIGFVELLEAPAAVGRADWA